MQQFLYFSLFHFSFGQLFETVKVPTANVIAFSLNNSNKTILIITRNLAHCMTSTLS